MHRLPPRFRPGPLDYSAAAALNQLAMDLYNSLFGKFAAAPPLQVRQGVDGVAYSLGAIEAGIQGIVTRKNSGTPDFGPRPRLNFIEGANIIIGMNDDPLNQEIDITITASLGAGPDPSCWSAFDGALDVNRNDYSPSSLFWWRLTRGASPPAPVNVDITGIVGAGDGCPILITHEGLTGGGATTNTITLKGTSAASVATNRFAEAVDIVLKQHDSVLVRYDNILGRQRVLRYPAASLGQAGLVSLADQVLGAGKKAVPDKLGVGVVPGSILANSALDQRGYTYAYFAGAISFGGGNTPASEADGTLLQFSSPDVILTMPAAAYLSNRVGGFAVRGSSGKFRLHHRTASARGFGYHNDDTGTDQDGVTGTFDQVTTQGGVVVGGTNTSTITTGSTIVSGGTSPNILTTDAGGLLSQTSFADAENVLTAQAFGF